MKSEIKQFRGPGQGRPLIVDDSVIEESRKEMIHYLLEGSKPPREWKTGTELELIGYQKEGLSRLGFEKIEKVMSCYSSEPIMDAGWLVGMRSTKGSLTVEPGGQLEFSGTPQLSLLETERALQEYLVWVGGVARELGMIFLAVGFDPVRALEEQRWVEKPRYSIMRPYLQARDKRGLDMMTRTAAIQVNIDYESSVDLAEKFVVGNRLGPIIGGIFANSPFREGKLSGVKSERALVWLATDNDRSGIARPALGTGFSLEEFLDYIFSVPMFLVRREGGYVDMTGLTYNEFLSGSRPSLKPVLGDFVDHLTTIFTEARLKRWIELRGADSCSLRECLALEALWKGLLYAPGVRGAVWRLLPDLNASEYVELQRDIARDGLAARSQGVNVLALARSLVELSVEGLKAVAPEETRFLDLLVERVVREGIAPADILIRNFEGSWHGQIEHAVEYLRVA